MCASRPRARVRDTLDVDGESAKRSKTDPSGGAGSPAPSTPSFTRRRTRANDAIFLRCVRNSSEVPDADAPPPAADAGRAEADASASEPLVSHPRFTNQLFENEEIVGYENPRVDVFYTAGSLMHHVEVSYDAKERDAARIEGVLDAHLGGAARQMRSRAAFRAAADEEFSLLQADSVRVLEEYGGGFVICKAAPLSRCANMRAFHERVQFHMLVSIDGASYIDADDDRWEMLCVFQRLSRPDCPQRLHFVGYATLYPFLGLAHPRELSAGFRERVRISQVFIMPHYAGQGHGSRLLQAIYKDGHARDCLEVTVEDPSDEFRLLRDVVDLRNAAQRGLLVRGGEGDGGGGGRTLLPVSAADVRSLQRTLRITRRQARRVWEIHALSQLAPSTLSDADADAEWRRFRLSIKRRLYADFEDVIESYTADERKAKLQELYEDVLAEYMAVLTRLKARGMSFRVLDT